MWPASVHCQTEELLWRFGFSRAIFSDRGENDTIAALQAWTLMVLKDRQVVADTSFVLYDSPERMARALDRNEIDTIVFQLIEYPQLPADLICGPCFRTNVGGLAHKQFVLLTRRDGTISEFRDLSDKRVVFFDDESTALTELWLDAELAAAGFGPVAEVVSDIERGPSASSSVLGVFFGKFDACVVSRRIFDSMAELNPQVAQQLEVLATSPWVLPSTFCFHSDYDEVQKERLLVEIERLNQTVAGQQVLNIFKADGIARIDDEALHRSIDLILSWQKAAER